MSPIDFSVRVVTYAIRRGFEIDEEQFRQDVEWLKTDDQDIARKSSLDKTFSEALNHLNDLGPFGFWYLDGDSDGLSLFVVHDFEDFGADGAGAHYVPASDKVPADDGLKCANCVFFYAGDFCEILDMAVEPEAVCRLWIMIPGDPGAGYDSGGSTSDET